MNSDHEYHNLMMIKGKRSKRQRLHQASTSSLALTMATSSSSTSSSDQQQFNNVCMSSTDKTTQVEQDMANCLILLAQGDQSQKTTTINIKDLFMYQCKTCDRSFPSFQALGGHRASHKRPKAQSTDHAIINQHESSSLSLFNRDSAICTTNTILSLQISSSDNYKSTNGNGKSISSSSKVHECSICGAEFTSGQALGGHMRRHRSSLLPRVAMPSHHHDSSDNEMKKAANVFSLDLNLPAPHEDMDQQIQTDQFGFGFGLNEQVVVFPTSAQLVDCHL